MEAFLALSVSLQAQQTNLRVLTHSVIMLLVTRGVI